MSVQKALRIVDMDEEGIDRAFKHDVLNGLGEPQKAIPARWFYDERGSQLFEDITRLPEYYPTRAEKEILRTHGGDFRRCIGAGRAVVEFGSGSSAKTPLLLKAIDPAAYVPIDISGDFLRASADRLARKLPELPIHPVEADFTRPVTMPSEIENVARLGFFPGSTIGNMVPRTAVDLLRDMRDTLERGSPVDIPPLLLIGMDRIKSRKLLIPAYDDARGATEAFNLNLLTRINRELAGNVPVDLFRHRAVWNDDCARIEMHLEAQRDMAFTVCGRDFSMAAGESIHTENSHKYGRRSATALLMAGGWTPIERWNDHESRFMVILAEATPLRSAP